jgi:long-chain acyl-CoA synthetase
MGYQEVKMQTTVQLVRRIYQEDPQLIAQIHRDKQGKLQNLTYKEFYQDVIAFALALQEFGVKEESMVGLLAENCQKWAVADLAVMALRAADVPRGRDITDKEISIIYGSTQCEVIFVERLVDKDRVIAQKKELKSLKHIIVFEDLENSKKTKERGVSIHSFSQLLEKGREKIEEKSSQIDKIVDAGLKEDLATIIFTSGTTGIPKGVMLSQHNYVNQADSILKCIAVSRGEIWLSILPVWHSFERCIQYVVFCNGLTMAYSKPIGSIMLQDFKDIQPHYTTAVPRIWEAVYNSIHKKVNAAGGIKKMMFRYFVGLGSRDVSMQQRVKGTIPRFKYRNRIVDFLVAIIPLMLLWPGKKLGDVLVFKTVKGIFGSRFKSGISGGGSLQKKIDKFFQAAGLILLEGYGLTESGPVLAVRTEWKPEVGTVGPEFPNMEVKIINERGESCKPGEKGVLYAKGCQIMKGYYKNHEQTAEVLSEDGWLNSGDLAVWTYDRTYAIVGRAKDTIVLLGGENIEPVPIEKNLSSHPLIEHVVVVGQDQKYLAALIVPNQDGLKELADQEKWSYNDWEDLLESSVVNEIYRKIIVDNIGSRQGFKSFEQIYKFKLLPQKFEVHKELSAKQELKRHKINEFYKKEIDRLY